MNALNVSEKKKKKIISIFSLEMLDFILIGILMVQQQLGKYQFGLIVNDLSSIHHFRS